MEDKMESIKLQQLEELRKTRDELLDRQQKEEEYLVKLKEQRDQIFANGQEALKAYKAEQKTLLDDEGIRLLEEREKCKRSKHSFLKWLLSFAALLVVSICLKSELQSKLSLDDNVFFIVFGSISFFGGILMTSLLNIPQNKKIKRLSKETAIAEYDDKIKKFEADRSIEEEKMKNDLKAEEESIKSRISECVALIGAVESEILVVGNPNTIFIATISKSYKYEIYLDGLIYQKHQGQNIIRIKVPKGIHSVRVVAISETSESTTVFELGTLQFNVQDDAFFCIVNRTVEEYTGAKFLEICTKKIKGISL